MATMNRAKRRVPVLPSLRPSMFWSRTRRADFPPFSASNARWFYFARNAIWLATRICGLSGAEVLVPAYHHGVEVEALVDAGAIPRFYRVGPRWDVDPDEVASRITERTRALYLIHYAGFPGPVQAMREIADRRGLLLIEDCALSLLSSDGSSPLGTVGDVAIFCLYKTLPVPNGGALVINGPRSYGIPEPPAPPFSSTLVHLSSSIANNLEMRGGRIGKGIRSVARTLGHGTTRAAGIETVGTGTQHFSRAHVDLGMSGLSRHLASRQDLQGIVERRRRNWFLLFAALRNVSEPLFHQLPPGVCPLFYPLVVDDKDAVRAKLADLGIETVDFWKHSHPACDLDRFPEVASLRRRIVELPCHQDLDAGAIGHVAQAVVRAMGSGIPVRARARADER